MVDAVNPVAIAMLRVAILFPCLLPQLLYKAGQLAGLVVLSAFLLASPSRAGENLAGAGTVAEWRANLGRSEVGQRHTRPA
jgi:hypothetical protein